MAASRLVRRCSRGALIVLLVALSLAVSDAGPRPEPPQARHEIVINAQRYEFAPGQLDVEEGDIVKVTLVADDIPHSFTLDEYRISKRARPGQSATFEFRADRPGTFTFYCALTLDDGCRNMKGTLVVTSRQY